MRTSARGSDGVRVVNRRIRHTRVVRRTSTGFTLLEMLVVLVIVGLLVAVVTLAPSRNRRTDLAEEAQRLANLLESAGDEAQVRSIPIAWQPIGGGYRFVQRTESGAWAPMSDDMYRARRWGAEVTGVSVRYTGGGEVPSRVVLGSEGIDVPVTITLWSGDVRMAVVGTGIGNFVVRRP
ncbi:GspH/FimT family pseudopilin [Burkholderia sp. AU30280]|uniref:GspH/FimT family pseudopilin n=1 Tax=Burkholderia sp. AU30280 TaxID=2879628 RepID=UPI001CF20063|nr:GspH/FimT family pseudopilin [Burkholderia sp. AU30280]MCA8274206.1 GspH/FimT family pseudopilin [Burkholderia sp. AU30280]